jgi:hypothetical protein
MHETSLIVRDTTECRTLSDGHDIPEIPPPGAYEGKKESVLAKRCAERWAWSTLQSPL